MPVKTLQSEAESLITILKSQVIPCWERFGTDRLAVTAKTLKQFQAQEPPELMRTSVKKRLGKRGTLRSRRWFNNTSSYKELWPEDDQATFRFPALIFIVSGQADFHVANYMLHCPAGHFLFFPRDVPRCIGNHPHLESDLAAQRECSVLWFFAPPGTNSVTAYVCHSRDNRHWSDKYHVVIRTEVLHFYQALTQEIEDEGEFVELCFSAFLKYLLRELQNNQFYREGSSRHSNLPKSTASPVEEARQYIKTHLNQQLTAEQVAAQVHMSRSNFLRHWSHESEESLLDFIIRHRMEEAGRLLHQGHWSIERICRFTGLRPTQFRAQFKQYFGVNPSEFRKEASNPSKMRRN